MKNMYIIGGLLIVGLGVISFVMSPNTPNEQQAVAATATEETVATTTTSNWARASCNGDV